MDITVAELLTSVRRKTGWNSSFIGEVFLYVKINSMQKKKKPRSATPKTNFKINEFQKLMNQHTQKMESRNFRQVKINMPRRPK